MRTQRFDVLSRNVAAGVSRRASLLTLAGAAATAMSAMPRPSAARKGGRSCGKKQQKHCRSNRSDCLAQVPAACQKDAECQTLLSPCCDECFSAAFLGCLVAAN